MIEQYIINLTKRWIFAVLDVHLDRCCIGFFRVWTTLPLKTVGSPSVQRSCPISCLNFVILTFDFWPQNSIKVYIRHEKPVYHIASNLNFLQLFILESGQTRDRQIDGQTGMEQRLIERVNLLKKPSTCIAPCMVKTTLKRPGMELVLVVNSSFR